MLAACFAWRERRTALMSCASGSRTAEDARTGSTGEGRGGGCGRVHGKLASGTMSSTVTRNSTATTRSSTAHTGPVKTTQTTVSAVTSTLSSFVAPSQRLQDQGQGQGQEHREHEPSNNVLVIVCGAVVGVVVLGMIMLTIWLWCRSRRKKSPSKKEDGEDSVDCAANRKSDVTQTKGRSAVDDVEILETGQGRPVTSTTSAWENRASFVPLTPPVNPFGSAESVCSSWPAADTDTKGDGASDVTCFTPRLGKRHVPPPQRSHTRAGERKMEQTDQHEKARASDVNRAPGRSLSPTLSAAEHARSPINEQQHGTPLQAHGQNRRPSPLILKDVRTNQSFTSSPQPSLQPSQSVSIITPNSPHAHAHRSTQRDTDASTQRSATTGLSSLLSLYTDSLSSEW